MAGYFQILAGILSTGFLNLSKRGYAEEKQTSQLLVPVLALQCADGLWALMRAEAHTAFSFLCL